MRLILRTWRLWAIFVVLALSSAFVELSGAPRPVSRETHEFANLADAVYSSGDFNMLQSLASSVKGHEELLNPETPFTVFAPRNVAFTRFSQSELNQIWIPGNGSQWTGIFWHHVARGNFRDLKDGQTLTQLDGGTVRISSRDGRLAVDGIPVIDRLVTRTSVLYVIDSLLIPRK